MAAGLTQEALAAELGMAVQNLGRIEQGRIDIRYSTLVRLAKALGLDGPVELVRAPTIPNPGKGRPKK